MTQRVLFVDDDRNILSSMKRHLRSEYTIETALGAHDALTLLDRGERFAVVVSDMRMPEIDGVEFLKRVAKICPLTVRVMLTGNVDQDTAVRAVNEGSVYRFVNKPCNSADFAKVLREGISQYLILSAERELLQNTLSGTIKLLTDLMSMVDPQRFEGTLNAREIIQKLCRELRIENAWELELACMLGRLGEITLPSSIQEKIRSQSALSQEESKLAREAPECAASLLQNIPRLDGVATIVRDFSAPESKQSSESVQLISIARQFAQQRTLGKSEKDSLAATRSTCCWCRAPLLDALEKVVGGTNSPSADGVEAIQLTVRELVPGHRLLSAIETSDGVLLVAPGTELTGPLITRVRNYQKLVGIKEPIQIFGRVAPVLN